MAAPTMVAHRDVWGDTLVALGALYPDLVVLDGDMASSTRADRFEAAYPDRFFQMGIAEQNMAGVAAGLATLGFVPWVSSLAVFQVKRMLDQVRLVIAQPRLNVKLAGHYSGLLAGRTGKTHISIQDLTVMRAMPNMTVVVPADGVELKQAMQALMEHHGPAYLRLARDPSPVYFGPEYRFRLGKAAVLREGWDLTIVGTGIQTLRALDAAADLAREGIEAHVLHVPTLKPLDREAIVAAAARTGRVLTTEEHTVLGGLGAAVAEVLSQERPTLMRIHGLQDTYAESAANEDLLEKYRLSPRYVAAEARALLARAR